MLLLLRRRIKRKHKKRMWVRKIFQERKQKGEFHLLIQELRIHDQEYFFKYFRMSPTRYEHFLGMVAPLITKSSVKRETIGASERLSVTLRYLVTGDSQVTIATSFRISPTSIGRIINDTSEAIWITLKEKYMMAPQNENQWKVIASEFERKWNFNHCIGAIDGKHVVMQAPARSGSLFFNYKKTHSIVLMAVCNANYEFTLIDIGDTGRNSDGGVFSSSQLGIDVNENLLKIPNEEDILNTTASFPFVLVGDEAFPLKQNLMKPYPKELLAIKERIFNYRLSRARRIIENSFGILAARFRIFRRPIIARESVVVNVTKASVALHNYLMYGREFEPSSCTYCPANFTDEETINGTRAGAWRGEVQGYQGLQPLPRQLGSNNYTRDAKKVREMFRDYFNSEQGQVPWQYQSVTSTHNTFDQQI